MPNKTQQPKTQKIPKLRFPGFSDGWEEKKLGDIAEVTSSKRIFLSDYVNNGIPFFRGKEISELKRSKTASDVLYIKESKFLEFKNKFGAPQKDDILITSVGTLGNVYRVNLDYDFYFKDGNLIWLKKLKENSSFFEVALDFYKKELLKGVIGSTQKALTIDGIKKVQIPFPSLPEQQKIGEFLAVVDEWIENLKKQKESYESYKKALMQKIFSQEIRFKDDKGKEFPKWEEKKLKEVAEIVGGGTPDTTKDEYWQGEINWFTPTEIKQKYSKGSLRKISKAGLLNSSAKLLPVGAILFTSRATVGDVSISTEECSTNQGFQSFIANDKTSNVFLYYWVLQNKNEFLRRANGSTFLEISGTEIKKMKSFFPFLPEQLKIAEFLTSVDKIIESKQQQITQAEQWKKGLMQGLFV